MPKKPRDERERDEDRGHDAHQMGALVELEIEHHPHRVRGRVDRRQQAIGLLVQPVQVGSSGWSKPISAPMSNPTRWKTACSART
jgi:hypothetical protein